MKLTLKRANELMDKNNGSLDLRGTNITALPEGLTVGGSLDLRGTNITALPEGLTVGGSLYLRGSSITALPEGLTVGGILDLSYTNITVLPESLTTLGFLCVAGTSIKNTKDIRVLRHGDYKEGNYLYCDDILTHVKKKKTVNGYTYFLGKIPGRNVVFDGTNYAHCDDWREGIRDLIFKSANDRGSGQYKNVSLDTEMSVDDLVTMYRVITGACHQGCESFVASFGDKLKEKYTVQEAIELTRGKYGGERFKAFFTEK